MDTSPLVNEKVRVQVSDPWEFGTECGVGPFGAVIVAAWRDVLLLRLEKPIEYRGARLVCVVAKPRHASDTTESLASAGTLAANFSFLRTVVTTESQLDDQARAGMVPAIGSVERRTGSTR
jgi:hypothetical protein